MRRRSILAAAALVIILLGWLVFRPPAIAAAPVVRGTAVEAVYASGTIEPAFRAEVRARASGPLVELRVKEGEAVRQGELLARIDAPALGFDLKRGNADRDAARARKETAPQLERLRAEERGLVAQLESAQADVTRAGELVRTGVKPPAEGERARTQLKSAESSLEANRAQQRDVGMLLDADVNRSTAGAASLAARADDAEIRSPIDGVVLFLRIERGETVLQNQSILRVGDLSRIHVEAQVDEADVGRVEIGTQALLRIAAFDEHPLSGKVTRIAPEADRERRSFQIDIELIDPPPGLRPGMTAEVNLLTRRREHALLVPAEALSSSQNQRLSGEHSGVVYVLRGGRAIAVPVALGIRDLAQVEIVSGDLREGELVLLGAVEIESGARVRPQLAAMAKSN